MGSYCRVVGEEGYRERTRQNLGKWGQSLQQDALKGLYMGRHVGCFFLFLFLNCFEQKREFYSSGMAYAADRSQLQSKTHNVFASQSEGSILGRPTSPAQPEKQQACFIFSEIFSILQRYTQRQTSRNNTCLYFKNA